MSKEKKETEKIEINETSETKLTQIFNALMADFPKEAEQRTTKQETRKSYDTTGYGYQYCVNRFNNVMSSFKEKWGYNWEIIKTIEGTYSTGKPFFEIIIKMDIWIFESTYIRSCVGTHTSLTYGDALKGAITNAFKKTASFWGVGWKAFAGAIDDDNLPHPENENYRQSNKSQPNKQQTPQKTDANKDRLSQCQYISDKIMKISGNNKEAAVEMLKILSAYDYTNKNTGKKMIFNGYTSFQHLFEKATNTSLGILYGKVKNKYEKEYLPHIANLSESEQIPEQTSENDPIPF